MHDRDYRNAALSGPGVRPRHTIVAMYAAIKTART